MSEHRFGRGDLALALLICVVWAVNFLTSAYALREIPPFLFSALRMGMLALLLCAFVKAPPRAQWPRLIAVALLNGALHFGTSLWALRMAGDVSSPAIVMQSYIPISVLLAWWLLGERFGAACKDAGGDKEVPNPGAHRPLRGAAVAAGG